MVVVPLISGDEEEQKDQREVRTSEKTKGGRGGGRPKEVELEFEADPYSSRTPNIEL